MTKFLNLTACFILSTYLFSCSSSTENQSKAENEEDSNKPELTKSVSSPAVCIWSNISVRQTPGTKGKRVTVLSIGESLSYLGIDSVVEERTYAKILLNDGDEGWARKDFIVENAEPAVILNDVSLYSRPDLLTKTDELFSKMDIVSSIEKQEDWIKIKGKRADGKWIDEGWIKTNNISYDVTDIATAKFAKKALEIEDTTDQIKAIQEIIENPDLNQSAFIAELVVYITGLNESNTKVEEEPAIEENTSGLIE